MVAAGPRAPPPSAVHSASPRGLPRGASPGAEPASLGAGPEVPLAARREGGSARAQRDGPTSGTRGSASPFWRPACPARARGSGFLLLGDRCPQHPVCACAGRAALRIPGCKSLKWSGWGEKCAGSWQVSGTSRKTDRPRKGYRVLVWNVCRNPSWAAGSGSSSLPWPWSPLRPRPFLFEPKPGICVTKQLIHHQGMARTCSCCT